MNILFPTYSYYPYNFGGTEVYVSGLADYLQLQGHTVVIIAVAPDEAFLKHGVFFEDEIIKTTYYSVKKTGVIGVQLKNKTADDLYIKYRAGMVLSWQKLFARLPQPKWDIVHFHAHTALANRSITDAVKKKSPAVKVLFSYHLPFSCPKKKLIYGNRLTECRVTPEVNTCTACYIAENKNWQASVLKPLVFCLPAVSAKYLPFIFRLKYLIAGSIASFKKMAASTHRWLVFSADIRDILLLNGINEQQVAVQPHGVNSIFMEKPSIKSERPEEVTVFLYAGRFDVVKGLHTLLHSWSLLKEKSTRRLEIAGAMQDVSKEIEQAIEKVKHRQDIIWHGKKTQEEIAAIMAHTHCVVIPSECFETGPLIFHEAVSKGCDVIASDIGGCRSLAIQYSSKASLFRTGDKTLLRNALENFVYSGVHLPVTLQEYNYRSIENEYKLLCEQ